MSRHPLLLLFRYVGQHRKYAALTIFFGVLGFVLSFAYPWIIGAAVDTIVAPSGPPLAERRAHIVWLTELAAATAVLHAMVVYGRGHFNVHLGDGVVTNIRRALFEHLQTLSIQFFTKERTGSVLSHILHDVREATALIYTGVIVVGLDAVQLVIAIVLLLSISPALTGACLLLFPLYAVVFALMNPRVRAASERMHGMFSRIAGNVSERLAGQALIKTYTAEAHEARRFAEEVDEHHRRVVAQSHAGHLVASAGEIIVHAGTTIVVGYGGWLALGGAMTAGAMTRFLGYMLIMFGPVRRFAELNITYQTSLSAMRRVFSLFDVAPSVAEPAHPHSRPPERGHVVFDAVSFRYDGRSPSEGDRRGEGWVLDGVSFEVQPGERVAIVGSSGAGKTTLVSLLPRLYDPTAGRLLVDGVDVRDYGLHALRSSIAIVQQESFIFTGTIRENISYGRPESDDEEVVRAAIAAHAHEFIVRLPDGYDTMLGERGVNLSGGQRQRLSIARALLKDPRILVLDEGTSSLDTESESIVQRALERTLGSRTCFIVAHRLSTIRNADRIFVLDRGRIAECGTHGELLSRRGVYARLVEHQGAAP